MNKPAPTAPPPQDAESLAAAVLAAPVPLQALHEALAALVAEQRPARAAALYESICYRLPPPDYWTHFTLSRIYASLGPAHDDATFAHTAAALQCGPDNDGADQLYRRLFLLLVRRGQDRVALGLIRHQVALRPECPVVAPHELAPVLRRLGEAEVLPRPPRPPRDDAWHLHRVVEAETLAAWACPVWGGPPPPWLHPLRAPQPRPAIDIAEFADAEVILHRNLVVVLDRDGRIHPDFCVGEHSQQARDRVLALDPPRVARHEADTAVVVADRFPAPNIGHFLFDQITRLALYRRLGVPLAAALVIGPEPALPAQREILRRAGVAAHLGTERTARVRVRRLFVSSTCRGLCHPLHHAAGWAIDYAREILGGRGSKGWRRLYLSRRDDAGRRIVNEHEVTDLLDAHGFEPVQPARLPYDAQIALFKQASHVVAPHGAALTHMLLLPPGAHVLELFHPRYGNPAYATLAAGTDLRYAALLARDWESDAPEWNDPQHATPVDDSIGIRNMRVPVEVLARYLATAL